MRDGWSKVRLGDVVDVNPSAVSFKPDDEVRYIDISSVSAESGIDLSTVETLRFGDAPSRARRLVQADDVLLSTVRPYLRAFAVVPPALDGQVASTGFAVLRARHGIEPGYVWALVRTNRFVAEMMDRATGSNYPAVRAADVAQYEVLLPPVHEQRRIVDLIAAADRLCAAYARAEATAEATLRSLRCACIDDDEGPRVPLSDLVTIESGLVSPEDPPYSRMLHIGVDRIESATGRVLPLVTAAEEGITSGKHLVAADDIVYSKIRPNLRKVAAPGFVALCSADAYPLRPKTGVDPHYVKHLLLSDAFTAAAVAKSGRTKMPKINRAELFSIPVPAPPPAHQQEVGALLASAENARDRALDARRSVEALTLSLLEALLDGTSAIPSAYDTILAA